MQGPTTANLLRCQHGAQDPTITPQCQHVAQDPTTTPSQHSMQNGAAVGMVAVVDSGMVATGWQQWQGTPTTSDCTYFIYKLILFLYFVIKANNILLLLSITDVKSNNNK